MSFTYDTATACGKVRLLIQDTDEDNALFTDEEIAIFLEMEDSAIRSAAALSLEALASDKARLAKRQKTLNFDKDTRGVAKELREQAASLRASASEAPQYGYAEINSGILMENEILENQAIRDST